MAYRTNNKNATQLWAIGLLLEVIGAAHRHYAEVVDAIGHDGASRTGATPCLTVAVLTDALRQYRMEDGFRWSSRDKQASMVRGVLNGLTREDVLTRFTGRGASGRDAKMWGPGEEWLYAEEIAADAANHAKVLVAEEVGRSNAAACIDQVGEYESRRDALEAYRQNTFDTMYENGHPFAMSGYAEDAFIALLKDNGWGDVFSEDWY